MQQKQLVKKIKNFNNYETRMRNYQNGGISLEVARIKQFECLNCDDTGCILCDPNFEQKRSLLFEKTKEDLKKLKGEI